MSTLHRLLLKKARIWEFESEFRLISYRGDIPPDLLGGDGPGLHHFRQEELVGIIFGAKTTEEHKAFIYDWASQRRGPLTFS
jgi:hypothetical protein